MSALRALFGRLLPPAPLHAHPRHARRRQRPATVDYPKGPR